MAEKKNQHYVPQMHLRYFSCDREKLLINILHKKSNKRIDNVPIKSQASEDYFYGNDCILENSLGILESTTKKIYEDIIGQNILPQHLSEKHFILLLYVIFSKIRTRKQLEKLHESQNLIFQSILSKTDEFKDIAPDYEIRIDNAFDLIFQIASKVYYLAHDLEFKLLKNETDKPFILSDNPTIFFNDLNNQKGHKITNGKGLGCKGLQIIFPMSPNYILFFYDSWAYKLGSKKSRTISINDEKTVEQFNILQILNSNEVLFLNSSVTDNYINELINKSFEYKAFEEQELQEFLIENKKNDSVIFIINSSPDLKLTMNGYKLQDRAKAWLPDRRIVYYRSKWHESEIEKNRRSDK